jgi:hypothetical protein
MPLYPFVRLLRSAFIVLIAAAPVVAQSVHITVDANQDKVAVSPYIYGRNGGLSHDAQQPLPESDWQFLRDSGVRMLREHGGNNGTKYNWQKKLTSHPDWYNNVYGNDWDYAQTSVQQHLPGVQVMWCFQLIGKVANSTTHNFDDWGYNKSQWWSGVGQNLAGGGTPNASGGGKALKEGDPSLYLTDSSAATDTAILDHWIKSSDLGLDRGQFRYWNMDNEPEIWDGTHDDVMPTQLSAEAFLQRYFDYAKQARAKYPEIKLVGPVPANEWQWFNWGGGLVTADGKKYPWLEYFIKRVGEEQARTGIRLLDVLDIHYYPGAKDPAAVVQLHRTFFDTTYVNPDANAVHSVNGTYDASITQEYIFGRCQQWMDKYLGARHGVTLACTETGIPLTNAPAASVWYASTLGEFMKHGVEIFTPWSWQPGMWEVLHLYARYNYTTAVRGVSDDETNVSAYPTVDPTTGNTTVVLVNRSLDQVKQTTVSLAGLSIPDRSYSTLQLSDLPSTETFASHSSNALKNGSVTVVNGQFSVSLPPLSVTSVLLRPADITTTPPPSSASRLVNLSVRARSGSSDDVLILGFVIAGTGTEQVLLRGIGPGLKPFGISSYLTDPALTLFNSKGSQITTNDDWSSDAATAPDLATLSAKLGAFSLEQSSADAAFAPVLANGVYTFHVRGKGGAQGAALAEVYEGDVTGNARFVNVAARTWVGTDANVLIAGFVISGPAQKTVLIRGVGPELARYGVAGVLADPVLRVFRAGVDTPIFQNDDWGSTAYADQIAKTAERIGAGSVTTGSKDAALLLTLPSGVYTAIVSGSGNSTGVGLVEVYEAD